MSLDQPFIENYGSKTLHLPEDPNPVEKAAPTTLNVSFKVADSISCQAPLGFVLKRQRVAPDQASLNLQDATLAFSTGQKF